MTLIFLPPCLVFLQLARATPLAQVRTNTPAQREKLHPLQQRFAGHALLALPLQSGDRDDTVVIDSASRRPVAVLPINPWPASKAGR